MTPGGRETPGLGAHPDREQSVAAGKAARQLAPLASQRDFSAAASRDPVGCSWARPIPGAGAGAGAPRADAGLAVHLLPRRGAADGRRPGRDADAPACGCSCAVTPTCRTSGCSPRRSGGWSSTSTTSTRRCPGRSSGTSSGWPRASRSPAATTGSRRKKRRRVVAGRRRRLPERDAGSSPPCRTWTSGTRTSTSMTPSRSSSRQLERRRCAAAEADGRQGPHPRQHAGVRASSPTSSTAGAGSSATRR